MGKIYQIPVVDAMTFTSTGFSPFPITSLNSAQRNAWNVIVSQGISITKTDYEVSTGFGDYIGFYTNNSVYYIGSNFHGGVHYLALKSQDNLYGAVNSQSHSPGIFIAEYGHPIAILPSGIEPYSSYQELYDALSDIVRVPITYRPTNCSFPNAPTLAAVGDTVVVTVAFPDGYGLVNESNIYVTNNGVVIPSTYSNGQLTFTMPDPS